MTNHLIQKIKSQLKFLAITDAVIEQEWADRYFSYNANWSDTEEVASFRDGCGGEWFVWFTDKHAAYKCISPEDGLISDFNSIANTIPKEYSEFINEPAFSMDYTSCIWYVDGERWIKQGKSIEYLIDLEEIISWSARDYHGWATEYYEKELDLTAIEAIFSGQVNHEIYKKINPELDLAILKQELLEIGSYPISI